MPVQQANLCTGPEMGGSSSRCIPGPHLGARGPPPSGGLGPLSSPSWSARSRRCPGDAEWDHLSVMVKLLLWSAGLEVTATVEPLVLTRVNRFSLACAGSFPSSLLTLALPWPFSPHHTRVKRNAIALVLVVWS